MFRKTREEFSLYKGITQHADPERLEPQVRDDKQQTSQRSTQYVLAADTSSRNLSLALWKGDKLIGQKNLSGPRGRSHLFAAVLEGLLKEAGIPIRKIKIAAFGFGPGSYTGLRIGLVSLKALLVSQPELKAVGFSSLDLIASGITGPKIFGVTVDARREKIYANFYRKERNSLKHLSEKPRLFCIEELRTETEGSSKGDKIALTGDALRRYGGELKGIKNCELLKPAFWYPKARNALNLIHHQAHCGNWLDLSEIRPAYLRRSEAEEKWGLCYDERDMQD